MTPLDPAGICEQPAIQHGEELVAVAVLDLFRPGTLACRIFEGSMVALLRHAGIRILRHHPMFGAGFVLVQVVVAERTPAVKAAIQALAEMGLDHCSAVAYWDESELIWRSVFGAQGGLQFGRLLTPEAVRAARDILAAEADYTRALMEQREGKKP